MRTLKTPKETDPRWIQLLMNPEIRQIKSLPIKIALERARRVYQKNQDQATLLQAIGQMKDFLAKNESLLGAEIEDLFNF